MCNRSTMHTMTVEFTLQTALKIDASNLYCKITLFWLDSSLSVENIDLVNKNKASFLGKIKHMALNKLGFSESWQHQGSNQPNHLLRQMCKRARNIYQCHWRTNVHNPDSHNKLRTYMKFKFSFKFENDLSIMTKFDSRKLFTKLRISTHDL